MHDALDPRFAEQLPAAPADRALQTTPIPASGFASRAINAALPLRRLSVEDQRVAVVLMLTLATGVVDAVSYVSLDHVFTANMSGNMAIVGIGAASGLAAVVGNIFAFAGFVAGSVLAARLLRALTAAPRRKALSALRLELSFLAALTGLFAAVDVPGEDPWRYCACAVLAMAMGVQTAVARQLNVKDVNTTVATMTLHDLSAAARLAGGKSERWRRRFAVVVALLVGATLGVLADRIVPWGGMALTTAIVALAFLLTVLAEDEDSE